MEKFGIECKKLMVEEIKEGLKGAGSLFITSFNTLAVLEQEELRRKLKEVDASFFVVKNRIARRAFEQLKIETLSPIMHGLTAIARGGDDPICVSKALVNFAAKHENFKILQAYVDQQPIDPNSVKRLASIPSREALLSSVVWGFKSPIQRLINSLSATVQKFVVVVNKIREKK